MILATPERVREMDKITINEEGIPGVVLMENAGKGTFEIFVEKYIEQWERILVIVGKGNNGGDGCVIARYLFNNGYDVKIAHIGKEGDLKGHAGGNFNVAKNFGVPIEYFEESVTGLKKLIEESDVIIDALLGTGFKPPLKENYREIINMVNKSGKTALAVDIPSGLDAFTGTPGDIAVKAKATCTMGLGKVGLVSYPGSKYAGDVYVIDISFPKHIAYKDPKYFLLTSGMGILKLPERDSASHKGNFGHLFVLGGSTGKTGASLMAGLAALRSGTGLVTTAFQDYLKEYSESKPYELMLHYYNKGNNSLDNQELSKLLKEIKNRDALVLGPGLGQNKDAVKLVNYILEFYDGKILIDADGLNILSDNIDLLKKTKAEIVLTPHPGEFSRLTGISTKDIQNNRVDNALAFVKKYPVTLVLKGARTLIATKKGELFVSPFDNPFMATAGMGDILSGIIGGFMAQGYDNVKSSVMGVYFHALAAEKASKGPGLIATDILTYLPEILLEFTDENY